VPKREPGEGGLQLSRLGASSADSTDSVVSLTRSEEMFFFSYRSNLRNRLVV